MQFSLKLYKNANILKKNEPAMKQGIALLRGDLTKIYQNFNFLFFCEKSHGSPCSSEFLKVFRLYILHKNVDAKNSLKSQIP